MPFPATLDGSGKVDKILLPISADRLPTLALPSITLAISLATAAEDGLTNLIYIFTRTGANTTPLTVNYTVGGTATLGTDYTGIPTGGTIKTVTFAAGSSTATLIVDPIADATIEANETVALTLSNGTGYTIGTTSAVVGTITNDDSSLTLYNAASGRPSDQGWLTFGGLNGSQTRSSNGTTLASATLGAAGYSNYANAAPTLINSAFPKLDRSVGFSLDFRLQVLNESHQTNNRAGFTVIVLDQGPIPRGIELGFWSDRIFSQQGGSIPFQNIGEGVNGFSTTTATTYSLRILDQAYYLLAGNRLVLSGAVQDYSLWQKDPLLPYNPYTTSNFLFLGDNTRSAGATVELGNISLGVSLTGSSGADTFAGTAAADSFNGLAGADQLNGGADNDWLAGGAGADTMNGGAGDDVLIGGSEADRFLFASVASFDSGQLGIDTIVDFNPAEDRLRLARNTFTALAAGPSLSTTAFAVVSSDGAAATSTASIVYNSTNGSLFYNPNGSASGFATPPSGGGLFARLWGSGSGGPFPALNSGVFEVV
ncbi:MAG: hypothetical protein ACKO45_07325 [Cyanobium sp.]